MKTVCCIIAFLYSSAIGAQSFTISDILSAPFPQELIASPDGEQAVWVFNDRGRRNIWISEAPDFQARQITRYSEDDGQEVTDIQFTPDGKNVIYVRGGAPNRNGEIPNPALAPREMQREIWMVAVDASSPQRLAEGSNPVIAPDGVGLAFIRGGQVWYVELKPGAAAEKLFHIRGRASSLSWSPNIDRSQIAFVSSRGTHSFLGMYDLVTRELRYVSPGIDREGNPVWSPDGSRIAYTLMPNERNTLPFMPRRSGYPWSIWLYDMTGDSTRMVWQSDEDDGSVFRSVAASNQILWGAGDHLIFPWEKTGWTQLYSLGIHTGSVVCLTPGESEVQYVSLSGDRAHVVYSSNHGDIDRQHIWRSAVEGGTAEQLTAGIGIQWAPAMSRSGRIYFLASTGTTPANPAYLNDSGAIESLAPNATPTRFPAEDLVEPEQVIFSGADGLTIHGQLFKPKNTGAGERCPAVIFLHGGSRRQMLLGFHHRGYYHNAYALNQYLADRGYIVLSVNYRSGIGYGMEFREAILYGATGGSEFNDVLGAGLYLQSRSDVDSSCIGLWGGSYGGYLTALGLARASHLFAAGVDIHGVHDWNVGIANFRPSYRPESRPEFARIAFESSPMAHLDTWRSPVLLIHGDDDRNVNFRETVELAEELRKRDVYLEYLVFPDEVHGFLLHRNWISAYEATADFFDRMLKK